MGRRWEVGTLAITQLSQSANDLTSPRHPIPSSETYPNNDERAPIFVECQTHGGLAEPAGSIDPARAQVSTCLTLSYTQWERMYFNERAIVVAT